MTTSSKREQLIETALKLFARQGFHAVGIDTILEQSGVAKKTLYNHFKSKEELILAVLRYYDERFRNHFMRAVEAKTPDPVQRLSALFDVAEDWFRQDDFHGCLFVGAAGEYPEADTAIRQTCKESKKSVFGFITKLAAEAGAQNPDRLAQQLVLLLEGAVSMAKIHRSPVSAAQAKEAAQPLIKNALPGPTATQKSI